MTQKFSNNARTVLAAGISASDVSLSVQSGDGDLFPVADTGTGPLFQIGTACVVMGQTWRPGGS